MVRADGGLTQERRRTRLIPPSAVAAVLDIDVRAVYELVEVGRLRWAWNVAAGHRMFLRVLPECLSDCMASRECQLGFEDVIGLLTPDPCETVTAFELSRILNVKPGSLVYRLLARKELHSLTEGKPGQGGSARITKASIVKFLARRAYPFAVPLPGGGH